MLLCDWFQAVVFFLMSAFAFFSDFMFYFEVLMDIFLVALPVFIRFSPPSMLIVPPLIPSTCSWLSLPFCTVLPVIVMFVILGFPVRLSKLRVPRRLQADLGVFASDWWIFLSTQPEIG